MRAPKQASAATQKQPFTRAQVLAESRLSRPLIIVHGMVYDVTDFVESHPGGDVLLDWHGQDATEIMDDAASSHAHSDAAYRILEKYCIGTVATASLSTSEDGFTQPITISSASSSSLPNLAKKYDDIFNFDEPIFWQLWSAENLTLARYLEQIHTPRMPTRQVRFFAHPFLEFFTRNYWWSIPMLWLPVSAGLFNYSLQFLPTISTCAAFAFGIAIWGLIEYFLHRFIFHLDEGLPENKIAMMLHFTFHGVHHLLPMDR